MTSFLISSGASPITLDEIRTAVGLQSHSLDGLILAAIAHHSIQHEIVPTTWNEDERATERRRAKGHTPVEIWDVPGGRRLVSYSPTERQIDVCRQRIVVWLLQQDDVHFAREKEIASRLANARISIGYSA
jgi:hypothetical protein